MAMECMKMCMNNIKDLSRSSGAKPVTAAILHGIQSLVSPPRGSFLANSANGLDGVN